MVVAGCHTAVGVEQVGTAQIQAVTAALVGDGSFHLLVLLQHDVLNFIIEHVGVTCACGFGDASGHIGLGHFNPAGGCERLLFERAGFIPLVLFARSTAYGVIAYGIFQTSKNLVAHQHGAARIAHNDGCRASSLCVDVVDHGDDVEHVHVAHALEFHFGA